MREKNGVKSSVIRPWLLHKHWLASCPWEKAPWVQLGIKRRRKTVQELNRLHITPEKLKWHPSSTISPRHKRALKSGTRNRLHTSEYLKSSARFIPSVWRTDSFSPSLLVLSLSRQRVMPFTSWITVLRARDASREDRSKYTLVSGSAKETWWGKTSTCKEAWTPGSITSTLLFGQKAD